MGGAPDGQRWGLGVLDLAGCLAAVELGRFAEVGQQVARHIAAAAALGVVFSRRDG